LPMASVRRRGVGSVGGNEPSCRMRSATWSWTISGCATRCAGSSSTADGSSARDSVWIAMSAKSEAEERDGVPLTNLDQPLFDGAGAAKRDLVEYLDAVRDRILPVLEDRPLSV